MLNPYNGIDWNTVLTIPSISHAHSRNPDRTMNLVNLCVPNLGSKIHLNLSNYHGSYPLYPLTDLASIPYFEKREWCRKRGADSDTFEAEECARLEADNTYIPIHLQEYVDNIDLTKIIECPNSEHHRFRINGSDPDTYNRWHMNSVGSTYGDGHSRLDEEALGNGSEIEWTLFMDRVFDNLLYDDGGGITINHPNWTGEAHLPFNVLLQAFDYDDRVLGIEVYNDGDREATYPHYADDYIDAVLKTGRRCWLFAAPDHMHETQHPNDWRGVNVLLCNSLDNHECLRAYRNGNFYAKIIPDSPLKFESITFNDGTLSVRTSNATRISLIVDGESETINGSSFSKYIGTDHIYARVKAETNTADDYIYSNPIMLDGRIMTKESSQELALLYS